MARSEPQKVKSGRFNALATEDEVSEFKKACAEMQIEHTDVLRSLAAAFARHVKKHKRVTLPIELAPPEPRKQ